MPERVFGSFCDDLKALGRRRKLRRFARGEQSGQINCDGRSLIDFSANDYLALSHHPMLIERACEWAQRYGAGSRASRLLSGNLEIFEAVESKLAKMKKTEAALIMASGFQANVTILAALLDKEVHGVTPLVFADRLNHASIHAGCKLAGVRQFRYRHNDLDHLETLLKEKTAVGRAEKSRPIFILSETVFSMDGDLADVGALAALADRYGAFLYLDEAHATGVFGDKGFGLSTLYPGGAHLVMGTFGKALGCYGAYAACSEQLRDYLINRCKGLIYSTALPPAILGSIDAAIDLVPGMDEDRARLLANAEALRKDLTGKGFDCGLSGSQIIPLILRGDRETLAAATRFEAQGILAPPIRPPTVPEGEVRLRISLTSAHGEAELVALKNAAAGLEAGRGTLTRKAASWPGKAAS